MSLKCKVIAISISLALLGVIVFGFAIGNPAVLIIVFGLVYMFFTA